jgi:hypothetical protein
LKVNLIQLGRIEGGRKLVADVTTIFKIILMFKAILLDKARVADLSNIHLNGCYGLEGENAIASA